MLPTSTGGDGGGEDSFTSNLTTSFGCAGRFINRGKRKRKPNLGGRGKRIGRPGKDPEPKFKGCGGPLNKRPGQASGVRKDAVNEGPRVGTRPMATLGTTYNLEPHMRSERWPRIDGYIQAQFGKTYNTNKATLKREHWIKDPETGAYDLDQIRRGKPDEYTDDENRRRQPKRNLQRSTRSIVCTLLTVYSKILRLSGWELEASGEHTAAEINDDQGRKLRGTSMAWVRWLRYALLGKIQVEPAGARGVIVRAGEDGDDYGGLRMVAMTRCFGRSFPSDMSLENLLPPWHQFLDQKIRGAHFSLRIDAGECFAIELTPSTFPQRHFAGNRFPQRHVAGERVGMLLGKASNVVVHVRVKQNEIERE
ncbi:hypothetical protein Tco_0756750 [Tanacetum coccineum]